MALDQATVAKIAYLARIKLADEAVPGLQQELSSILTWVEQLDAVDTKGVEPMTSVVHQGLRRRQDAVIDGGTADPVLANAPDSQAGFYAVPKVVE